MSTKKYKAIIGRAEQLDFVEFGINGVPAKTDTGAYRSAVHADHITIDEDGILHFRLLGGHPICSPLAQELTASEYKQVTVANSFGHTEERYEVKLKVSIGGKIFVTGFTLADRSKKIYPILLGRRLLNGRFMVDTDIAGIDRQELKTDYRIEFPNDEEDGRV